MRFTTRPASQTMVAMATQIPTTWTMWRLNWRPRGWLLEKIAVGLREGHLTVTCSSLLSGECVWWIFVMSVFQTTPYLFEKYTEHPWWQGWRELHIYVVHICTDCLSNHTFSLWKTFKNLMPHFFTLGIHRSRGNGERVPTEITAKKSTVSSIIIPY